VVSEADIEGVTRNNLAQSAVFLLLIAVLMWTALGRASSASGARSGPDPVRPNVVLIQTDDQSLMSLKSTFRDYWDHRRPTMPNTVGLIGAKGIEFTNYYVSNPLCGPSRAALLSGQYAHTSHMKNNSGPEGGWTGWQNQPIMNENLAVALDRAGYRTAHVGKFTNNYFRGNDPDAVETTVPPGWDHWYVPAYGSRLYYYGTRLNDDGVAEGPFGIKGYDMQGVGTDPPECTAANLVDPVPGVICNHSTDLFSRDAVEQIEQSGDAPFYLQVDYNTPHGDYRSPNGAQPLSRHYDSALKTRMPRPAGFNEADVADKPSFVQALPHLTRQEQEQINVRWQKDLESLRGVDDGVGAIVKALKRTGKLKNTYVIFISDNGQFNGEHRMSSSKFLPYEPSAHQPLLIRGPGIKPGSRTSQLAANVDLAPTVLSLTGARLPRGYDGRSLKPYWKNPKKRSRRAIVLEGYSGPNDVPPVDASTSATAPIRSFSGLRAGRYKYVEYTNGERELYDLKSDPAELRNRFGDPAWRRIAARLAHELSARKNCRGATCRAGTGRLPLPPKTRHRKVVR
jgi:arylsulfatase A-like enzyme